MDKIGSLEYEIYGQKIKVSQDIFEVFSVWVPKGAVERACCFRRTCNQLCNFLFSIFTSRDLLIKKGAALEGVVQTLKKDIQKAETDS